MVNMRFNGTLGHHNPSSPPSAGEINKDEFIEALNIIVSKF